MTKHEQIVLDDNNIKLLRIPQWSGDTTTLLSQVHFSIRSHVILEHRRCMLGTWIGQEQRLCRPPCQVHPGERASQSFSHSSVVSSKSQPNPGAVGRFWSARPPFSKCAQTKHVTACFLCETVAAKVNKEGFETLVKLAMQVKFGHLLVRVATFHTPTPTRVAASFVVRYRSTAQSTAVRIRKLQTQYRAFSATTLSCDFSMTGSRPLSPVCHGKPLFVKAAGQQLCGVGEGRRSFRVSGADAMLFPNRGEYCSSFVTIFDEGIHHIHAANFDSKERCCLLPAIFEIDLGSETKNLTFATSAS